MSIPKSKAFYDLMCVNSVDPLAQFLLIFPLCLISHQENQKNNYRTTLNSFLNMILSHTLHLVSFFLLFLSVLMKFVPIL